MKIKRTWTSRSLRAGQEEIIDETKAREIIGMTMLARHPIGRCGKEDCEHCPEVAMKKLAEGEKLKQFFCDLEMVSA